MGILIRLAVTAFALWVSTALPGIDITAGSFLAKLGTLLAVAVLFGLINAILKPIVKALGCVLYIVTLGLIALVVNALLFWLTSWLADKLDLPWHVKGFWPAFWGAIIVGVVSWALNLFVPDAGDRKAES